MRKTIQLFFVLLSFIFVAGIAAASWHISLVPRVFNAKEQITIGGATVFAYVADTPVKRTRGLSGKSELALNEGMFFIFEYPTIPEFWMKDMFFPIDIVWIGEDKRVVATSDNLSPDSYPEVFSPQTPVMYVLEVPAGFVLKNGIKSGDEMVVRQKSALPAR